MSQEIAKLVMEINVEVIDSFSQLFMYQGFSPESVLAHFQSIKTKKNIPNAEFKNDIAKLITMGVIMGNYNENNSQKIAEEGKATGDALFIKYDMKKGGVGKEKKAVTLPRVLATFPDTTIQMVIKGPEKNYNGPLGANDLDKQFKSAVFPAVVPTNITTTVKVALLAVSTCYTTEQTLAISQDRSKQWPEVMKQQQQYTLASHSSSVPPNDRRKAVFSTFKFNYGTMKQVYNTAKEQIPSMPVFPTESEFKNAGVVLV